MNNSDEYLRERLNRKPVGLFSILPPMPPMTHHKPKNPTVYVTRYVMALDTNHAYAIQGCWRDTPEEAREANNPDPDYKLHRICTIVSEVKD